ncbi:MAG TPA: hypothetical protein VN812_16760, partial [Candidatus Acidoferrales bacterium]|nr:hypothetical protein [Candidatus Acidoferrales bacterium]
KILFVEHLLNHFDVREAFAEATGGVFLERYFQILALFMTHVFGAMKEEGAQWIALDSLLRNVRITQRAEADLILRRWVCTPEQYENSCRDWQSSGPGTVSELGFDFIPLKRTPLIEGRSREAISPVLPFLLAKALDEPYFILCDHLGATDPKRLQQFQDALGRAYEDYGHTLVERIAGLDQAGEWTPYFGPRDRSGELADSLLVRSDTAVCFEHKGGRPATEFLRGGEGERVLGPSIGVLDRLEGGETVSLREGRDQDHGLFTRALWQQNIAGNNLIAWLRERGVTVKKVFALVTYSRGLARRRNSPPAVSGRADLQGGFVCRAVLAWSSVA